jgi:hypothetical protein
MPKEEKVEEPKTISKEEQTKRTNEINEKIKQLQEELKFEFVPGVIVTHGNVTALLNFNLLPLEEKK